MQDFEKLGVFYLGRQFDPASRSLKDELVLYDSKDLVTHAVCVGMTGSGKTGLCLALLEEAAIDGIPAILVDPKGDLGNLLLTFPRLESADFRPWIDEAEAGAPGITPSSLPTRRQESGARAWPNGGRTPRGSNASGLPSTWRSTRRVAVRGCRWRCCGRSPPCRGACSTMPTPCVSGSPPPSRGSWPC